MSWQNELKSERDFLQEQIDAITHKLRRLEGALNACRDCLEREGLERTLHTVQDEHAILKDLLARLQRDDAPPLEAMIMERRKTHNGAAQRAAHQWRRGAPTPDQYWDAENRYMLFGRLLRQLHAWQAGQVDDSGRKNGLTSSHQPLPDPTHFGEIYTHPWYIAPNGSNGGTDHQNGTLERLEALRNAAYDRLAAIGYPDNHLSIIAPADRIVIVRGYAHSEEERERAITAILQIDGLWEELSDIKVVAPDQCPACDPEKAQPDRADKPAHLRRRTRESSGKNGTS